MARVSLYLLIGILLKITLHAQSVEITWYGHSAFQIIGPEGTRILVDPWVQNMLNPRGDKIFRKLKKTDFILLSHGHGDNLGDSLHLLKISKAQVITTYGLANALIQILKYPPERLPPELSADIGGTVIANDELQVLFTPAKHSSEVMDTTGKLHFAGSAVGFVIKFKGGPNIYFTGDSDVFMDMKLIPLFDPIDLMLVCVGGHFSMDPSRAALATMMIKPKWVAPMKFQTYQLLRGSKEDFFLELQRSQYRGDLFHLEINEAKLFPPKQNSLEN